VEIGETIFKAFQKSLDKDPFCDGEKSDPTNWQARINQWGSKGGCSGKNLYDSLRKWNGKKTGFLSGPPPYIAKPSRTGFKWDFSKVDEDHFPIQAHHHGVCTFLAQKYTKHPKYRLTADTEYSNDHAHNGYCLPYATPLTEWKEAGGNDSLKLDITFIMMEETGRQLHQGSHREGPYDGDPGDDPDEEAKIHPSGYLNAVRKYLNAVLSVTEDHVDTCPICKPNDSKKDINPIAATVKHVDQVSGIIKLLVDANRIFISEPAFIWLKSHPGKLVRPQWLKGR
jgi:hypothetical protein